MSEALNHTLVQVRLRLERGLQLAEQELAETRDRCTRLELVIRSIRAQRSELVLLERPEIARKLEAAPDRAVVRIPEMAVGSDPTAEPAQEDGSADAEIPTSYMPMLEELWDIARHSDPE
jgi:hypothetical protein